MALPSFLVDGMGGVLIGLLVLGVVDRLEKLSPLQAGAAQAEPLPAALSHGTAGFIVTPIRLVFEGRKRAASVTVVNTGSAPATYRLTLVRMRMSQTGDIHPVEVPLPGEAFADTLVRFSPRQFEVVPRASQVVRLQLRKPAGLADGEYRSHLLVQEIPRLAANIGPTVDRDPVDVGLQVRLTPVFGSAIPVIVRHGATAAAVTLEDLRFRAARSPSEPQTVFLKLVRRGNRSVYGDLEWRYLRDGAKPRLIGRMRGLAVYTPNRDRQVQISLPRTSRPPAKDKRLLVSFMENGHYVPAIAETSFILP